MTFPKKLKKLELRSVLVGMLLGDGCLNKITSKSNSRFSLGHSLKQHEYCKHKFELLDYYIQCGYKIKELSRISKKTGKTYKVIQGATKVDRYFTKLRKILYHNNIKIINKKILNYLDLRGIAYWFMDDGGNRPSHKRRYINGLFLSTQSFNYAEHIIIRDWFKEKFDIKVSIVKHGHGKFRINFNKENSIKLKTLIKPYILEQFNYKLILEYSELEIERQSRTD